MPILSYLSYAKKITNLEEKCPCNEIRDSCYKLIFSPPEELLSSVPMLLACCEPVSVVETCHIVACPDYHTNTMTSEYDTNHTIAVTEIRMHRQNKYL